MSAKPSPYRVDLEKLLYPISVDKPAGESLRYEGTYDRVREARRQDEAELSQGIYKTELKKADWTQVEALCLDALETRSKDLQLATWLLEAWLHLYGFTGILDGFNLMTGLCESFWDDLYPSLDGDNVEYRIAPLEWINDKLTVQIKQIPITSPATGDVKSYTWADWEAACHLEHISKKEPKALQAAEAKGSTTTTKFQSSVMLSPKKYFVSLNENLADLDEAIANLESLLEKRCGPKAPSLYQFKDALRSISHMTLEVLKAREDENGNGYNGDPEAQFDFVDEEPEQEAMWSSGPIRSRAEAYRRLAEVAEYLLRTEPHSPTPYLIKRAVTWGSMSLFEIFSQVIRNDGELQELNRLLRMVDKEEKR
ncbi:MAG TPA: type VI secretion system protein TssA [Blastocatellia bacterium]|nr:type VI secretion system protein TssA [Blastocatellia bacterium]